MRESFLSRLISDRIVHEAYKLAESAHAGQLRKTGGDYIDHPVAVEGIARSYGADYQTRAAAMLHDVVEDTAITLEQIRDGFGNTIAFLVDGVTKPQKSSSEKTFEKIERYSKKDKRVLLIKCADRIHNLQTPINLLSFRNKYRYTTENFLIPLARQYGFINIVKKLEDLLLSLRGEE